MAKRGRDETGGRRSEIVTVRFDPKLKYLAELAARKQRRPLSSFIEWAVERNLEQVVLQEDFAGDKTTVSDAQRIYQLWDLDDSDRVIRLALHFPDLLTHDEQLIWKHVRECGYLWRGKYSGDPPEWEMGGEARRDHLGPTARILADFQSGCSRHQKCKRFALLAEDGRSFVDR